MKAWYAIDSNSVLSIDHINKLEFLPIDIKKGVDIGYTENGKVWCKIKIHNKGKETKTWLCFDNSTIDSLILYTNNANKLLGDRTTNTSPFLSTQSFELNLKPNEEKIIIVSVKKIAAFLNFSFYLSDEKVLVEDSKVKLAAISFLLGMIFLLFIFNQILYFITKSKMYIYYSLVVIFAGLYVAITTNYLKYVIFQNFMYFSEMRYYVGVFWFIFFTLFLAFFLDLKKHQVKKYKIIVYLNLLNGVLMIVAIPPQYLGEYAMLKGLVMINYVNHLAITIIIIWMALAHLKIDKKSATYVLIAFTPQLIWACHSILASFQIIEGSMGENSLIISCCYEVLLFGFVLSKNYIETFQKNNLLIKEIILERENSLQAITQTQIRERRSIANLLHDNVGSKIAYISQLLQLKNVGVATENIKELADEVREISHKILPKSLDDGALLSSLQDQINSLNIGLKNTMISLSSYDFPEEIHQPWVYDLYLMSLEIINNAVKHGQAKAVEIEFYKYKDYYLFQFTDDGIGFNTNVVKKGFGLENIEKRVIHYKGVFELNSNENFGTVIQIKMPFHT